MSRARELAKFGGLGQQVVAGVSSHVGVSTFAANVFMYEDLSVIGNLNVTGDLSYDETTATNSRILGVSTTTDLVVTQNADVAGIVSATAFDGNLSGDVTSTGSNSFGQVSVSGVVTATSFDGNLALSDVTGLGANVATFLATPSSANLRSALTDETGSGAAVFATSPTISGPTISGTAACAVVTASSDVRVSGNANVAGVSTFTGAANFGSHVTITGNLTVDGTTTTVNSTTLTVDDKNIELGATASPSDTSADGGGITLKGSTDHTFNWVNSTDAWTSSEHMDLAAGKSFKIGGNNVLSATSLGSGVVSSSLTSVGTIATGVWQGTAIANGYLANSTISGVSLGSNLNTLTISTGLSGSSYNGSGAVTIAIDSTVCTLTGTQTLTNKTIGAATISGHQTPDTNNTYDSGSSANRWRNVYSNDLDLSNEGSVNDVDGTWGSYLIQEGEEHLYIINRRSGKKFRFMLEEV